MIDEKAVIELNSKLRTPSLWPRAILLWCIGFCISLFIPPQGIVAMFYLLLAPFSIPFIRKKNRERKTTEITYAEGAFNKDAFGEFLGGFSALVKCQAIKEQTYSTETENYKYNAGASHLVSRRTADAKIGASEWISTNIKVAQLHTDPPILFFPDKVLILKNRTYLMIEYRDIQVKTSTGPFIESGMFYPKETPITGHTWQYVNKSGGPDKRMKKNRKLPILLYDVLEIKVRDEYHELLYCSAAGSAKTFAESLRTYCECLEDSKSESESF